MDFANLKKQFGIGLTGGVATGKSTAARIIREAGYVVVDADQLSRQAVEPGTEGLAAVVREFGNEVLDESGALDRARLRRRVFSDPASRKKLEGILHPRIAQLSEQALEREGLFANPRFWFYEAALLFETGGAVGFHSVWVTYCPYATQIERLQARNNLSRKEAQQIVDQQMPAEEKRARANFVIDTSAPVEAWRQDLEWALASLGED